jgi:integrase
MHGSAHGRVTHWDAIVKHFGVRITPAGLKTFVVLLGSGRRQSIGHYPTITLAQARDKAKRILAERTLGRHQASAISWQSATEKFIEACRSKTRPCTHLEYERSLKRYFAFGSTRLSEISKQQIAQKLEKLNKTPSQRAHALVICKMFFRWALMSGYLDVDPTAAFKRSRQPRRARVLSDHELQCIWRACEQTDASELRDVATLVRSQVQVSSDAPPRLPASYCTIVKLLLVTGQRRGEIAALRSSWIKDDAITLPSHITKNGIEHTFPIGKVGRLFWRITALPKACYFQHVAKPTPHSAAGPTQRPRCGQSSGRISNISRCTICDALSAAILAVWASRLISRSGLSIM